MKMVFSVIICTYQRPKEIIRLLNSIENQSLEPNEVIIIDGSLGEDTYLEIHKNSFRFCIKYFHVNEDFRGLTKQRNFGLRELNNKSEIVFFLDDDLLLEENFFQNMLFTFEDKEAVGCDGFITNENFWFPNLNGVSKWNLRIINLDGYSLKLSYRDFVRRLLGLYPTNIQPGRIPKYGHGKTSLPPTGIKYEVDHLMGCMMAYRTEIFGHISFSNFFEGYGLYEDFDFSVRASRFGKLITNTSAKCEHHHAPGGRPDFLKFGEMVVKNGYYVWILKYPNPRLIDRFKWHSNTLLLAHLRLANVLSKSNSQAAARDYAGRMMSWIRIILNVK
jgi:GT2 family glycosyltransferase